MCLTHFVITCGIADPVWSGECFGVSGPDWYWWAGDLDQPPVAAGPPTGFPSPHQGLPTHPPAG